MEGSLDTESLGAAGALVAVPVAEQNGSSVGEAVGAVASLVEADSGAEVPDGRLVAHGDGVTAVLGAVVIGGAVVWVSEFEE